MNKRIVAIIFGLIFLGLGIYMFNNSKRLNKNCTVETVGIIVDVERHSSRNDEGKTEYSYCPIIQYVANNRTIRKMSSTSTRTESISSPYTIGEEVTILYNPNNVEEFILKGDKTENFLGIVFCVAGLIIIVAGIVNKVE